MYKRIDPLTKQEFETNKSNKFFIDKETQIMYNNKVAKERRQIKAETNKALNKNWRTFLKILGNNSEIIKSKEFLLGAGIDFRYYTPTMYYNSNPDIMVYVVYDVCFYQVDKNNYKITKHGK